MLGAKLTGGSAGGSSPQSSAAASASRGVACTARLDVANPDQSLRPGMTATADILTEERNNVLLVPNAALRFKPNTGGDRDSTLVGSLTPRGDRKSTRLNSSH